MKQMKLVFIFPENIVEEPITYNLISEYGIRVNILRASIDPGKQGQMVVELSGEEVQISQGLNYLENAGVLVTPLAQKMSLAGSAATTFSELTIFCCALAAG